MPKFEDYEYKRVDLKWVENKVNEILDKFINAKDANTQIDAIRELNEVNKEIDTAFTLCSIRYSLNVEDKFYEAEEEYCDEIAPQIQSIFSKFDKAIVDSKFKKELTEVYGPRFVENAEISIKTFDNCIIEDLINDNKLSSKYSKLTASARIEYNGETYSLTQLGKFTTSNDRKVRKEVSHLVSSWFNEHLEEYDSIYDEMVKTRTNIAKKLGFKNYMEYRYLKLYRTEYDWNDVERYRNDIYKYVVPVANSLFARQAKRLGIKDMQYYDYNLEFNSGNPTPYGSTQEKIALASKMYHEMSKETDEFFSFMVENNLLDLEARHGKQGGGYTTFISKYKAPYIFSNFNGTSGDVDVLTHEAGHAFMAFRCRDVNLIDNLFPTNECAEIHSMSMEFFAYPWMNLFFKEQTEKYKFTHCNGTVTFLPYGVAVDEFQTFVYTHPDITPLQRRKKWLEIEHKYLPHIKYDDDENMAKGIRWFRQSHIFTSPFYYIDYTIAQVCAFQFFNLANIDRKDAWERYVNLCNLGGKTTFLKLIGDKNVRIESPFNEDCIEKTIKPIKEFLDSFNDLDM